MNDITKDRPYILRLPHWQNKHFDTMTIDELHRLWDSKTTPKRGGKSSHSEHDLQTACVNWFRMQYREYANLLIAIPNGGQRDVRVARKLKAEGVVAGVPDLCPNIGFIVLIC